jgi:HK97 family phage portal protein
MARQVLMSSWSAGNYASRFWQQGGPPTTVIKTEQELNDTQASELSERWRNRRLQGPDYPAVLGRGADAKAFGADLTAGSAIEARREQDIEIARLFGVPVTYLGITLSGTSLEYSTLGDQVLSLDRFTLAGFYDPIQDTITDLLPSSDSEVENRRMVINMGPITQGNQESRYRAWSAALGQKPWMTPEEVREEEGRPPIELPEPEPEPVSAVAENEREGVPVA